MDNAITLSITPLQAILNIAFMVWIFVVFPIIVIRKLNYMTAILHDQFYSDPETNADVSSESEPS